MIGGLRPLNLPVGGGSNRWKGNIREGKSVPILKVEFYTNFEKFSLLIFRKNFLRKISSQIDFSYEKLAKVIGILMLFGNLLVLRYRLSVIKEAKVRGWRILEWNFKNRNVSSSKWVLECVSGIKIRIVFYSLFQKFDITCT